MIRTNSVCRNTEKIDTRLVAEWQKLSCQFLCWNPRNIRTENLLEQVSSSSRIWPNETWFDGNNTWCMFSLFRVHAVKQSRHRSHTRGKRKYCSIKIHFVCVGQVALCHLFVRVYDHLCWSIPDWKMGNPVETNSGKFSLRSGRRFVLLPRKSFCELFDTGCFENVRRISKICHFSDNYFLGYKQHFLTLSRRNYSSFKIVFFPDFHSKHDEIFPHIHTLHTWSN